MPIQVVCPGCHVRFQVSEKFAGQKGPCPKCKTVLTIPKPEDEVKIHVPEEHAGGGKDAKGRPVLKPIAREKSKISPLYVGVVATVVIGLFVAAFLLRSTANVWVVGVALAVLSPAIAWAAYGLLRNEELEPHQGISLAIRCIICGAVYAGLWGAYMFIPASFMQEIWSWAIIAVPFFGVGALAAYASFDLDVDNSLFHYAFYLVITILLRVALGWPAVMHAAGH